METDYTQAFLSPSVQIASSQLANNEKSLYEQRLQLQLAQALDLIHSVKNCMQNIAGMVSIARLKCEYNNIKIDAVEQIALEVNELAILMLDFINKTINTSGNLPYSINQLIQEVIKCRQAQFANKHIELKTSLTESLPSIMLSRQHIKQVIINCLNNSAAAIMSKAKPGGYISISTKLNENQNTIQILIEDNGVGLTPQQQLAFFRPYYTTKPQGSGIGTAISQIIIKQHGGNMSVSGKPNDGCCIRIELPIHNTPMFDYESFLNEVAEIFL